MYLVLAPQVRGSTRKGTKVPEAATTEVKSPTRVAIDTQLIDEVPVLVQIQADVWEPGKYGQQWHLALKPLSFMLTGKTGVYHEWAGISTHKMSKMGLMIAAFRKVLPTKDQNGEPLFIGENQYEGLNVWFVRRTIKLPGKDRETGENREFQVWIPIKEASDEDLEDAARLLEASIAAQKTGDGNRQAGVTNAAAASAPEADLPDEDVDALIAYFIGKGQKEVKIKAARSDLSKAAKAAVMSGYAESMLVDGQTVHIGADGKYAEGPGEAPTDAEPEAAAGTAETAGVA